MTMLPIYVDIKTERIADAFLRRRRSDKLLFTVSNLFSPPQVKRGGWDRRRVQFNEHPTYRLLHALHTSGYDPARCLRPLSDYYQAQGRKPVQARRKAVDRLFSYVGEYQALADSLRTHGYRSGVCKDEIGIAIGRDGSLIKVANGNHRLALVKILGIQEVVAEVRFVHREWLRQVDVPSGTPVREAIVAGLRQAGFTPRATPLASGSQNE